MLFRAIKSNQPITDILIHLVANINQLTINCNIMKGLEIKGNSITNLKVRSKAPKKTKKTRITIS
jgi:hypothetical protein